MTTDAHASAPSPSVVSQGPDGPVQPFDEDRLDTILNGRLFAPDSRTLDPGALAQLNDFTFDWASRLWETPIVTLAWPRRLYVPGEVDYRRYWPFPPPHDHVYQYDWTGSTSAPPQATAHNGTGGLSATATASNLAGRNRSWAGIALEYTPSAKLSQVRFSAEVAALAIYNYRLELAHPVAANFHSYATVFLVGWEINPVTGRWEQLPQFGRHTVFSYPAWGQGSGMPLVVPVTLPLDAVSVNFLVEHNKRYAFGVLFQATINADMRESNGQPYQPRPGDRVEIHSSLSGSTPRMTVRTTATYQ
jgi:hypothetical protein